MTTDTTTVTIDGIVYELPTVYTISDVCQGITVTLHRPAVREVEGTIGARGGQAVSERPPMTNEHKHLISVSRTLHRPSDETRKKQSESRQRAGQSEETKQKIRARLAEARQKRLDALQAQKEGK